MSEKEFDVVIVGAGFAGLYLLYRLRKMGLSAVALETADGVGGTWYWNRYPGARCDIESLQYSYQFSNELEQEWDWSERYSTQPEILKYAEHVADRFDLRRDIRFNTRVQSATFDEAAARWTLSDDKGGKTIGRHCVMATGCLSVPNRPKIKGLEDFAGPTYHTGQWPHETIDFTGLRVGVIGTGSSAIQSIPQIAKQAEQLFVFQRTANYSIPAHNAGMDPERMRHVKENYADLRAKAKLTPPGIFARFNNGAALAVSADERNAEYEQRWQEGGLTFMGAYDDLMLSQEANDTAANFVRAKIREVVEDPDLAELLCPTNIIGGKRLCVDTGYFETFNRDNVTLVNVKPQPIDEITATAIRVGETDYEIDALVIATGFDAMTGALLNIAIEGRDGQNLGDYWADGPHAYLGLAMAGFPNLFTVTGPGSPSVLTNMLPSIEQHVDWICDCIGYMGEASYSSIEAEPGAEKEWVAHVFDVANVALKSTTDSWYVGANIAGKPRVFMPYLGGFPEYIRKCEAVAAKGYEGFRLT
jgi:cation diffusion facilitator CzcD-associated flavoprotein CzcO